MRQLVRVAVVSAVLLGVLTWPAPVAAETAEQCLAALNGYRKAAGLDRASATSIPALAKAAANHAAYRVNVDRGNDDLLRALGLPDFGLFGPDRTAHLETPACPGSVSPESTPGTAPGRPSWPTAPGATSTRT